MPKPLLKECWTKALGNTKGFRAWKREGGIGLLTGLLTWYFLPVQDAMTEAKIITFAVVSALAILPLLEFLWNFIKSPIQILLERIEVLEKEKSTKKATNYKIKGHDVSGRWFGDQFVLDYSPIKTSLARVVDYTDETPEDDKIHRVDLPCPPNTLAKIKYSVRNNMRFFIRQADTQGGTEIFGSGIIDVPVNEFAEIELQFKSWIDSSKREKSKMSDHEIEIELLSWTKADD